MDLVLCSIEVWLEPRLEAVLCSSPILFFIYILFFFLEEIAVSYFIRPCIFTFFLLNISLTSSVNLQVQIWASNTIHTDKRSSMGIWDLKSLISSSPQLYGPEKLSSENEIPRHVKFEFRNPVRCRIVWIKLTLPQSESSSVNTEEEYNLFSFDENFTYKPKLPASDGIVNNNRCIHAKRLIVFGKSLKKEVDQDASLQVPEMMKIRSFLERSPQLSRFRVCSLFLFWLIKVD